jgi:hypothetical protein
LVPKIALSGIGQHFSTFFARSWAEEPLLEHGGQQVVPLFGIVPALLSKGWMLVAV